MPTNQESLNNDLYRLLSKYKPKPLDASGKITPIPDEADVFKFEFTKDGEEYGTVYATIDEDRVLTVYFGDDVANSPEGKTPGLDYDDSWWGLYQQLSAWRMTKGLKGFKTQNKDHVNDDMARRNHMRNKDKIAEGYYPMGKSRSYSDAVPTVKIVIEHSRVIEEGEQRYRNINRIFLENQDGERYLLDTKKPGVARVYARHIAEGGKVNDDRWNHVHSLCEEYSKMAGFVRATRNGQFNESAQSLVNEGIAHYQSLRESLGRMTGKRGYNSYFENWTPPLMEDGTEENNLNELFVQETLDPRIESVMPILNRIHKKVSESVVDKEMNKLAEWADSLVEEESIKSNNPVGIPEEEEVAEGILGSDPNRGQKVPQWAKRGIVGKIGRKLDPAWSDVQMTVPQHLLSKQSSAPATNSPATKDMSKAASVTPTRAIPQNAGTKPSVPVTKNVAKTIADKPGVEEGSHEDQVANLAAYNEKMAGENPPIDLGLREVGNWAKVGHYGDPIKTAWFNIANYGIRNNKFNDSVDKAMSAISDFPDKYDLSIPEIGTLYSAYETVYDQWEQSKSERGVSEEVDLGQYDAVKPISNSGTTPEQEKEFRKKVQAYGKELDQRQKEKAEKTDEGLDANQKRVGQLGPTEKVKNNNIGKLVGANENFINQADQAVVSEEDEMAEGVLDAIKRGVAGAKQFGKEVKDATKQAWDEEIPKLKQDWKNPIKTAFAEEDEMDEGTHTQHDSDLNPDDYERPPTDWSTDPIEAGTDRIHQKISGMLKKLSKPKDNQDLDEAAAPWEDDDEAEKREKEDKEPKDKKGSDGSEHGGHSRAKHLAKQAIPKEKEEVNESEERPYVCVHAKKGKCEVKASSSYQAAQKAAQKWGLKGTAGIDAHLADVEKDTSSLEESTDELARILQIMNHRR